MDRHRGQGAGRDSSGGSGETGECAEIQPLLEAFHHRALTPEQKRRVANHIAGCAMCSATLNGFAATDRLIAEAPVARPGPELRQRLAARIAATQTAHPTDFPYSMPLTPIKRTLVVNDMNDWNTSRFSEIATHRAATGKGWQRARVVIGTAAAALLVALLVGTLLTRAHGTAPQTKGTSPAAGNPTAAAACAPGKIHAAIPANSYLADLAMVSPGEGWAVGAIRPENRSGGPLILHYHHCDWTQVPLDIPIGEVDSVSMISADEGWAVGSTFSLADGNQPLVLHYTHGSWRRETLDALTPPYPMPLAVRMLSATEGWMTVNNGDLLHLDNGTWTAVNSPFGTFADILPVAPNQAWVAGFTAGDEPLLEKYDAGTWTPATFPAHVMIERLRMVAPNNIWASGFISAPSNQYVDRTAAVLHYDGGQWQQVAISTSGKPQIVHAFDSKTAWAFTVKPSSSPKLRWSNISAAQYQHDGAWHEVAWPFTNVVNISSINRTGPDTFWAIGTTLLGGVDTGYSALLYFANGSWHEYGG